MNDRVYFEWLQPILIENRCKGSGVILVGGGGGILGSLSINDGDEYENVKVNSRCLKLYRAHSILFIYFSKSKEHERL